MNPLHKLLLILTLGCAMLAAAQQPAPAPAPQTAETPAPQAAEATRAEEHHLTEAEAKEFFRSLDDILQFASEHTGFPILHPVKKKLATREEVARFVDARMKEQGGQRFDHSAVALKKLGLLPRDFNLREYMLSLYKDQVEGWYDAKSKTVYLLDWVDPEQQKPVMAHELVHALQDQSYDLDHWLSVRKDSKDTTGQMVIDEQRAARQAVIEGQAMIVLYDYQLVATGQTIQSQPELLSALQQPMLEEESTSTYAAAPIYLREGLLFPYSYGAQFVAAVMAKQGKQAAFAGVMEAPPLDTHQLMEPATYLSNEAQVQLRVPALEKVLGRDWKQDDFGGIGEIDLRVFCRQWGNNAIAARLAPAWRGGYYMTLANKKAPKDSPVPLALVLNFATPAAAAEFATVYETELPRRYSGVIPSPAHRSWQTNEGLVQLYLEQNRVIALESFSAEEAAKLHAALVAEAKPVAFAAAD